MMSKIDKETTMGGEKGSFETTRWTQIEKAKTHDLQRRQASVNNLMSRYWKPVYCYLRHKGYSNEDAKDLTQGFFFEIVFGRELIQKAEKTKGRFRTFLLTALDRYTTSEYRKETAKKRLPEYGLMQLDDAVISNLPVAESETTPEQEFDRAWARNLLDQVLTNMREEYYNEGRITHWEVLQDTVMAPILENVEAPSLAELCKKYDIDSKKKVSNIMVRVRIRFHNALRNHMRQFVQSDSEVDDEIRDLIEILPKGGAA